MKNKMKSKVNENSATVREEGIELGLGNHEKKCLENGQETSNQDKVVDSPIEREDISP
jgi:hypothetical protein